MNSITIVKPSGGKFESETIVQRLISVPNVSVSVHDPIENVFARARFNDGENAVLISVNRNLDALWVDGDGLDSLRFVWEFYQRFGQPLRLFDSTYSFDVDLSKLSSLDELEQVVYAGGRYDFHGR